MVDGVALHTPGCCAWSSAPVNQVDSRQRGPLQGMNHTPVGPVHPHRCTVYKTDDAGLWHCVEQGKYLSLHLFGRRFRDKHDDRSVGVLRQGLYPLLHHHSAHRQAQITSTDPYALRNSVA